MVIPIPIVLFNVLKGLEFTIVSVSFVVATASSLMLAGPKSQKQLYYDSNSSRTSRQCGPDSCCGSMKTAFLFVEQWLCAHTFPALFKMHKTHSDHGRQTRSYLVFLNRNVGRKFVFAFSWITYSIFLSSALVFLQ